MDGKVAELLERQSGVISRRQALASGLAPHDIRRRVRRREWATVHPGVYVDHTGPPSWVQRAWAAVLLAWPAALCRESALRAADGPGRRRTSEDEPVDVAIDRKRGVVAPPGVRVHQVAHLADRVQWNLGPPRVRLEEAVIDVAADQQRDFDAIAVLADAVQARRTTAGRLAATLAARQRVSRRRFLAGVIDDIASGTCSTLEHGYLDRVERPHGFPRGRRQPEAWSRGRVYRDVEYVDHGVIVELDGRLFHDTARARARDLDRDLDALTEHRLTARLGWAQVFDRPCETARRVATLLRQRGWTGAPVACPRCAASGLTVPGS